MKRSVKIILLTVSALSLAGFCFSYTNRNWKFDTWARKWSQPSPSPSPSPSPAASLQTIQWGAYTGDTLSAAEAFETRIGIPMDFLAYFVHWGNNNQFPTGLANRAKEKGQTLVIYWEAMDYNTGTPEDPRFSYDAIIRGDWDEYITGFGQQIKTAGQPVILIPFGEMNGEWYPWSITKNNNSAEKHKAAYRKIRELLSDIPQLKLAWSVNDDSVPDIPENSIANLYPGDPYVDIIGVDGFNFDSPWESFSDIFNTPLSTLETINKPIMIFSMASAEGPNKAAWIQDAAKQLMSHPQITGFIWFNENKEKDWRIWSDPNSLTAFQQLIQNLNPL